MPARRSKSAAPLIHHGDGSTPSRPARRPGTRHRSNSRPTTSMVIAVGMTEPMGAWTRHRVMTGVTA